MPSGTQQSYQQSTVFRPFPANPIRGNQAFEMQSISINLPAPTTPFPENQKKIFQQLLHLKNCRVIYGVIEK
jgi:hypothetical protein